MIGTAIAVILALLILWVPLPFGSVLQWSHDVIRVVAAIVLVLAAFKINRRGLRAVAIPAAAIALVGLLGILQASSWPIDMVESLSPDLARLAPSVEDGVIESAPLTLARTASRSTGITWLAVAACLIAAASASGSALWRRLLGASIIAAACFQVIFGAQHWFARSSSIWGVQIGGTVSRLRGSFVNPDHLAFYLGFALCVVFAWGWVSVRRALQVPAIERRIVLVVPPALLWLTLMAALSFTGSRAGLVAAIIATLVQGLLLALLAGRWRVGTVGLLAPVAGVLFVAIVGLQAGLGRWLATSGYELTWNERLVTYQASLDLWQRAPVLGTGLASFREAYPLVQPTEVGAFWRHAHNDYLEVMVTTGLGGAVILTVGGLALLLGLVRVLRYGERSEGRAAALAALGACVAVALHSGVDFALSMPANAVTFAIICGVAAAVPLRSDDEPFPGEKV
jgi:O-antigen ligase